MMTVLIVGKDQCAPLCSQLVPVHTRITSSCSASPKYQAFLLLSGRTPNSSQSKPLHERGGGRERDRERGGGTMEDIAILLLWNS